ncbi:unnamed protein product [Bursaphelenchus okinawaensis]|uniref:PLD phosphodiesterase domain-containing protein n=1 Tax=Bursaphelenchus okinawaensis TaxID=465554 RepID=A0A811LFC1_9BILA|nr:unnamed protein product [Bursaphelenchus okinawaensis]CAG9122074.1 unnamed protein product [Bursaphelenchus okinawaensis]
MRIFTLGGGKPRKQMPASSSWFPSWSDYVGRPKYDYFMTHDGRADMTNFEMDLLDTRVNNFPMEKEESEECCKNSIIKPACLPITILAILLLITFFMPLFNDDAENTKKFEKTGICTDFCSIDIVESIPTNLTYPGGPTHAPTHAAFLELLKNAQKTVQIAALYWNLREDVKKWPTAIQGENVYQALVDTGKRGVKIQIVQNSPSTQFPQLDSEDLQKLGLADVKSINFTQLFGHGVLHTKFWIVDDEHVYIGSANMDWKSLTEVKELGVLIRNCSCIATDLQKIFTIYSRIAEADSKIPSRWPLNLRTHFNHEHPLEINMNGKWQKTFISSSPEEFNPKGREHDLSAIVSVMERAEEHVNIAVMDYIPTTLYMGRGHDFYWPYLDNGIRAAAYRGVTVNLLISQWDHSRPEMLGFLRSLREINSVLPHREGKQGKINVKLFTVPKDEPYQKQLPFARVNHNKYMVTDNTAYVGTSNWAGDYFINTAGVGLIIKKDRSDTLVQQFNAVFDRDWNSKYAKELP